MSADDFIERHRHELLGMLLDAVTKQRTGGELSMWLKARTDQIETRLRQMFADLCGVDGKSAPPARASRDETAEALAEVRRGVRLMVAELGHPEAQ